eukprot:3869590-Amphidinium_carterae.1
MIFIRPGTAQFCRTCSSRSAARAPQGLAQDGVIYPSVAPWRVCSQTPSATRRTALPCSNTRLLRQRDLFWLVVKWRATATYAERLSIMLLSCHAT